MHDDIITYASWPKWRLFGFRGDPEGVLSLHLGKLSKPVQLRLNYECEPGGSIRAEVVNDRGQPLEADTSPGLAGCTLDASVPLEGSSLSAPVAWRERDMIDAFEGEVVLRLHMDRATAWAYETVGERGK